MEINVAVLKKYNLTEAEFLLLLALKRNPFLSKNISTLLDKKLIAKNPLNDEEYILAKEVPLIITNIHVESSKEIVQNDAYFTEMAMQMKEAYPRGKKPGTNYMWRGNTVEIVKRLKLLKAKYNFKFTKEQAIKATENYVSSFNGDYSKMRLLKYFLFKIDRKGDGTAEFTSDFMTFIENEGQENLTSSDWTDRVI